MSDDELIRLSSDALISLVVIEAQSREQKRIAQLAQEVPDFTPSPEFTKGISELLKKFHAKQRAIKIRKGIKATLIAATASISLFSISMFPSAPVREAVKDTIIQWGEKCAIFIYSNRNEPAIDMPVSIQLHYIPTDFKLQELAEYEDERYYSIYHSLNEQWFMVRIDFIGNSHKVALDNEYAHFYTLEFQEHSAIWAVMRDKSNVILWDNGDFSYKVSGNIDLAEMLKICENIEITH